MHFFDADATRAALPFDRLIPALHERFAGGCEAPPSHVHEIVNPLGEAGQDAAAVRAIVAPAGQSIGAHTPEEIALSVLAAVVAARRSGVVAVAAAAKPAPVPLPLSEMAPIAGSCCGGVDSAPTLLPEPVVTTAPLETTGGGSCCGN